jgi:hypothetical protein
MNQRLFCYSLSNAIFGCVHYGNDAHVQTNFENSLAAKRAGIFFSLFYFLKMSLPVFKTC